MGDISSEPSMEEILSSIKKIIAEDSVKAVSARIRPASRVSQPSTKVPIDPVVEEDVAPPEALAEIELESPAADHDEGKEDAVFELTEASISDDEDLISNDAMQQSRSALSSLSRLIVKPEVEGNDTLEGLVREMLRPMLKEWLDANLAEIVRNAVTREVSRITGRNI
jgi:uncharacterized protein